MQRRIGQVQRALCGGAALSRSAVGQAGAYVAAFRHRADDAIAEIPGAADRTGEGAPGDAKHAAALRKSSPR